MKYLFALLLSLGASFTFGQCPNCPGGMCPSGGCLGGMCPLPGVSQPPIPAVQPAANPVQMEEVDCTNNNPTGRPTTTIIMMKTVVIDGVPRQVPLKITFFSDVIKKEEKKEPEKPAEPVSLAWHI